VALLAHGCTKVLFEIMTEECTADNGRPGNAQPSQFPRAVLLASVLAGAVLGTFQIANTSIGWHLASGRWIVQNLAFLRSDPFSFTAAGVPWIDHEWIFQVVVAVADAAAGAPLLVVLRAAVVAIMAVLLLVIGVRSGLSPGVALLLSVLCICGARPRFFLRPELVTLLVVPTVVWIFLSRAERRSPAWLAAVAGLVVLGVNAHGGVLVVPFLLAGLLAAEALQMAVTGTWTLRPIVTGASAVAVAGVAVLVNPYGWRLYTVPFHLARLVGQPHIPNPEWVPASFAQTPFLFIAILLGLLLLGLYERRAERWLLLLMAAALALRHVRNLGLFFVLLPLAIAPALARWPALAAPARKDDPRSRRVQALAVVLSLVLAASLAAAPWPRFGFGFAENYFPEEACSFLERERLPGARLYNDVRFGGYLINRYFPSRGVFLDDRNEIHEPLLRRFWEIFQRSDVEGWEALLAQFEIDSALVRYHPTTRVRTPDGEDLGERGFSALWFPARDWALVYWDDVAMVLVRRNAAPDGLLERTEYHVLRPDDFAHLEARLVAEPTLRPTASAELRRALAANPGSERARRMAVYLGALNPDPLTDP